MRNKKYTGLLMFCLLISTACSTFKSDKQLSLSTAVQTAALGSELERFRKHQAFVADARLSSILRNEGLRIRAVTGQELRNEILIASGETAHVQLRKKLMELLSETKKLAEKEKQEIESFNTELQSVVSPISIPVAQIGIVQTGLAQLGREVSNSERLRLLGKFIEEVRLASDRLQDEAASMLTDNDS